MKKENNKIMMKRMFAVALAIVMTFALCACSIELGGEETWEYSSDELEGSKDIYNEFIGKTLSDTNQVMTMKSGDKVIYVETIDGTSEYNHAETTGANSYAFVADGVYYYGVEDPENNTKYYFTDKEMYDTGFRSYKSFLNLLDAFTEEDGIVFDTRVEGTANGTGDDRQSNATLKMTLTYEGETITVEATSVNELVTNMTMTSGDVVNTFTFEYGNASVTVPDLTDWTNLSEQN